eukprot:14167_1
MGAARATAFYLLLNGDDELLDSQGFEAVRKVKDIVSRTEVEPLVITTGSYLIIPTKHNDVAQGAWKDKCKRIYNFILAQDPVPMIFGGEGRHRFTALSGGLPLKLLQVLIIPLGTATTIGNYYVVLEEKAADGQVVSVDIKPLIDAGEDHKYLTNHLKHGSQYFSMLKPKAIKAFVQTFKEYHQIGTYVKDIRMYLKPSSVFTDEVSLFAPDMEPMRLNSHLT